MNLREQLVAALRNALPTLKVQADDEVASNATKALAGYPAKTVQQSIYKDAVAALAAEREDRDARRPQG